MHQSLRLSQNLQQTQKMVLSPRMQQSLKLLALPALELSNLVQQELVENPFLEESNSLESVEVSSRETEEAAAEEKDNEVEFDPDWMSYFADSSDSGPLPSSMEPGSDDYEPVIQQVESMKEALLQQLAIGTSDPNMFEIGSAIISQLDDSGYLLHPLESIAESLDVPAKQVEKALKLVQTFEPTGIAARDLKECLLIQHDSKEDADPVLRQIIEEHLEDLERRRYSRIAHALKVTEDKVQEMADALSSYEPIPGRQYLSPESEYLTPDVFVEKVDGEYQVRINDDGSPPLRISKKYRQMLLNRDGLTKEEYDFLKKKCTSAIWLVRNIEQRRQTLYKVTSKIMEIQREFLENGISSLKPLKLQDVANAIGVHETTVCRVVNNKYVQTPRGLFELKYFFSTGLNSGNGEDTASKAVMEMIRSIIDQENPVKPLSDQKIADILNERGIKIARRTVAKYRENMNILPTSMRKRVS